MIDRDLAEIYSVGTRVLNQAVKRNLERFPDVFMFQLSEQEFLNWKSQSVTSNSGKMGLRKRPFVFTEPGVAMLSSVLNSKTAIQINISIMRAFVAIRHSITVKPSDKLSVLQNEITELKLYLEEIFTDQNDINEDTRMQIELINQSLAELQSEKTVKQKPRRKKGFIAEND